MASGSKLGKEVRRRREALGLTLEELAERADLSPNYIGTVENGRRDPSLSTLESLAKGLGVPVSELFGPVKDLSAAAYDMGRSFDAAPAEVQELVVRVLRLAPRRRSTK